MSTNEKLTIEIFCFEYDYAQELYVSFNKNKPLIVESEGTRNFLLQHTITLLNHAAEHFIDHDVELTNKCNECVMNALTKVKHSVKPICIQYFKTLFTNSFEITQRMHFYITNILQTITTTVQMFRICLETESTTTTGLIKDFTNIAIDFYKTLMVRREIFDDLNSTNILQITVMTFKTFMGQPEMERFARNLIRFLKVMLNELELTEEDKINVHELCNDIPIYPQIIEVLEISAFHEYKSSVISQSWLMITDHFYKSLNQLKTEQYTSNSLKVHLQIVEQTLKAAFVLQHKSKSTILMFPVNQLPEITSGLQSAVHHSTNLNVDSLKSLIRSVSYFCGTNDFYELDSDTQMTFIQILFGPFLSILTNGSPDAFQTTIIQAINTNFINQTVELQIMTIQSLKYLNLSRFVCIKQREDVQRWIIAILNNARTVERLFQCLLDELKNLIALSFFTSTTTESLLFEILKQSRDSTALHEHISEHIRSIICLLNNNVRIEKRLDDERSGGGFDCTIICSICDKMMISDQKTTRDDDDVVLVNYSGITQDWLSLITPLFDLIKVDNEIVRLNMIQSIPSFYSHIKHDDYDHSLWIRLFQDECLEVRLSFTGRLNEIWNSLMSREHVPSDINNQIINDCVQALIETVYKSLSKPADDQNTVISMLCACAMADQQTDERFVKFFKVFLLFIISTESMVIDRATLGATEMCARRNLTPVMVVHSYKQTMLQLIVSLAVTIYLKKDIYLNKSLRTVCFIKQELQYTPDRFRTVPFPTSRRLKITC